MHIMEIFQCVLALIVVSHALPASYALGPKSLGPQLNLSNIAVAMDQIGQVSRLSYETAQELLRQQDHAACTAENVAIRKDWGVLSPPERTEYIDAVLCLQKKTAKTPAELAPGAKTRFDDFIVTHINQTQIIHYTATFLGWHRYFTWHYEQALRNECGYTGYQPYWNWPATAISGLSKSPIFDGSSTSLSGDGAYVPSEGNVVLGIEGDPSILLPRGTGGGCVTSGPFKNMTVNLGPVDLSLTNGTTVGSPETLTSGDTVGTPGTYRYNPRCFKRDLTDAVNQRYANATSLARLLLEPQDVYTFQMTMQGYVGSGEIGVHGGGHYAMGGDPGRDVAVSPGDPAFYLHHAMIDRTWWLWQMQDPGNRLSGPNAMIGTGTFLNSPPSPNVTYEDTINIGFATDEGPVEMGSVMSTTEGPFCYMYV